MEFGLGITDDFKKPGGFEQLLSVLEISEPKKRNQILAKILFEDPAWGNLIEQKMLTVERIITWPYHDGLEHLVYELSPNTLACAVSKLKDDKVENFLNCLPEELSQKVAEIIQSKKWDETEQFAAGASMIGLARKRIQEFVINLYEIDPEMQINAA